MPSGSPREKPDDNPKDEMVQILRSYLESVAPKDDEGNITPDGQIKIAHKLKRFMAEIQDK